MARCLGRAGHDRRSGHYRAAKLAIDQYGADASIQAAMRADALLDEGDIEGSAVWQAIVRAIKELQRERGPGEAVS
jgi:hypothetical protein